MSEQSARAMIDLTKSEGFLLDWLGKEDSSAYGECYGPELDRLKDLGLATWPIHTATGQPFNGFWARVRLTKAGLDELTRRKDRMPSHD